jgi:hypothetical protein
VFTHDMEVFQTYTLAPEPFTIGGAP